MKKMFVPVLGLRQVYSMFDHKGRVYGLRNCLLVFFMSFYHAAPIGIAVGLALSYFLNY